MGKRQPALMDRRDRACDVTSGCVEAACLQEGSLRLIAVALSQLTAAGG